MVSRFVARSLAALLAVTALAAGGCGSASPAGQDGQPPPGRLTAAEFRALHRALVAEKRIFRGHPLARAANRAGAICAPFSETQTDLMVAEASGCGHLVAFLQELVGSVGEIRACHADLDCVAAVFGSNARSAGSLVAAQQGVVRAVRRRGFAGPCAALLGHSRAELAVFRRLPAAYRASRAALIARDAARYKALGKTWRRASAALTDTADTGPADLGRRCRHE